MNYWDNGPPDSPWAVVMMLGMGFSSAILVVLIIWAVRSTRSASVLATPVLPSVAGGVTGYAEHVLADRPALDGIDSDEYRNKFEALRSTSAS